MENYLCKCREFFTEEEFEQFKLINDEEGKHLKHPLVYLDSNQKIDLNTYESFKIISKNKNDYFSKKIKEIKKENNFSSINAILGEMRTYGYLLEAFASKQYEINHIKTEENKKTPDFEVNNTSKNEKVYIEVNTKQHNLEESKKLKKFRDTNDEWFKEKRKNDNRTGVRLYERTIGVCPFGRSKDPINIDAIQKISQIKCRKYQIPKNETGILWIDLQSEDISGMLNIRQAKPLHYISNLGMFAGILWYGIYGKKGLPIFNSTIFDSAFTKEFKNIYKMKHDGLLVQRPDIAGVVVSEKDYTILFENPFSKKHLPNWFLERFIQINNFNYEYSIMRFPIYNIKRKIKQTYEIINNLEKLPCRSF